jgi:hypothetical protein
MAGITIVLWVINIMPILPHVIAVRNDVAIPGWQGNFAIQIMEP